MAFVIPSLYSFVEGYHARENFERDILSKEIANLNNLAIARQQELMLQSASVQFQDQMSARNTFQSAVSSGASGAQALAQAGLTSPTNFMAAQQGIQQYGSTVGTLRNQFDITGPTMFSDLSGINTTVDNRGRIATNGVATGLDVDTVGLSAAQRANQNLALQQTQLANARLAAQVNALQAAAPTATLTPTLSTSAVAAPTATSVTASSNPFARLSGSGQFGRPASPIVATTPVGSNNPSIFSQAQSESTRSASSLLAPAITSTPFNPSASVGAGLGPSSIGNLLLRYGASGL